MATELKNYFTRQLPLDIAIGLYTAAAIELSGGAAPTNVLKLGGALKRKAKDFIQLNLGEALIESQYKRGIEGLGFDFLSFTGKGSNAKLFINEVRTTLARCRKVSLRRSAWCAGTQGV